jgi:group I intron endonuclease
MHFIFLIKYKAHSILYIYAIIMSKIIGVYKILNNINGKFYIGYSKDIIHRFDIHQSKLKTNTHWNILLQRSYNKYKLENFQFIILHTFNNIKEAQNKELEYLEDVNIRELLFNLHYNNSGGDMLSFHPDKEKIIKNRINTQLLNNSKLSKLELSDKYGKKGEKNGMYGKTHTNIVKQKLSQKMLCNKYRLGIPLSEETKKKLSDFHKNKIQDKNPFYGKHHSEETKKILSEKLKNKPSPTKKPIYIDNILYESITEAGKKLNINISTISNRVKNIKFDNYKYANENIHIKKIETKISINNIKFNSIIEAEKILNISNEYIKRRLCSEDIEDNEWIITNEKRDSRIQKGKYISIDDVEYKSIKEASEKLNINENVIINRLKNKIIKIKIIINDKIYSSHKEASLDLNINRNTIAKRINSNNQKFKEYKIIKEEYNYKYLDKIPMSV